MATVAVEYSRSASSARRLHDFVLGDFADDHVMPCLTVLDVVHLEASSPGMWAATRTKRVLWAGASNLLKRFELSPDFAARVLNFESRSLVAELQQVSVCGTTAVKLADLEMVKALVTAHRKARERADAHLDAGGSVAEVFVACFRFPDITTPSTSRSPATTVDDLRAGWPVLYPSESIAVTLAPRTLRPQHLRPSASVVASRAVAPGGVSSELWRREPEMATSRSSSSLSSSDPAPKLPEQPQVDPQPAEQQSRTAPGVQKFAEVSGDTTLRPVRAAASVGAQHGETLDLRLAWFRDSMLISTQSRWTPPVAATGALQSDVDGSRSCFSIDVRAISPELFLRLRGTQDSVNGSWQGHGVCSTIRGRRAALRSLAEGLPCVLSVQDCFDPAAAASQWPSSVLDTLQLEAPRFHRLSI